VTRLSFGPARRRSALVGSLLAALIAVAGCGGGGSGGSGQIQRGGDLTIARTADSLTMDKTQMYDNESIWISLNIVEPLFQASNDGKSVIPWLATGYDLSQDKLSWTIHLRKGVTFHDGRPMTSKDVKFSIEVNGQEGSQWQFINAAIKDITAPDDSTVVVTTKTPWAPMLADLALFANGIIPENYGGQPKDAFYQHPIGTGAFQWDHWTKGQDLKLKRNPSYWQKGKPYLDSVTWTNVPDDNTRILQVKGSQVHIDEFPPWSSVSSLKSTPNVAVQVAESSRTDFLVFNEKHRPFQDVHVRRAIAYALDRQAMVKAALFGNGQVANSFLTPALFGYDPNLKATPHDVQKAKQEMAQSSVPSGFSTTLMVGSGQVTDNTLAQIVQQELKQIGIDVTLKTVDPNSATTLQQNFDYDMTFSYDTTDIVDPDELTQFAVGGDPGGTYSLWTNYNNPQVNQWIASAETTLDKDQRKQLYAKVQQQVAADAPLVPLYYSPFVYAMSAKVHDLQVLPTGNYHLENTWLSPS
jgi:peptide/nickel transport system substrate-binding protein